MRDVDANELEPLFLFLDTGDDSIVTIFVEVCVPGQPARVVPIDVTAYESAADLKRALGRLLALRESSSLLLYHDAREEKPVPDSCSLMSLQLESFQRFKCICSP
jgi:hypothetical protein